MSNQVTPHFEKGVNPESVKVLHVITGLKMGGAAMMLYKSSIVEFEKAGIHNVVACLGPKGEISALLEDTAADVHILAFKKNIFFPFRFWKLVRLVRKVQPDVIQGWMSHGNLIATLARFFSASKAALFWNIRQSLDSLRNEKFNTALVILLLQPAFGNAETHIV